MRTGPPFFDDFFITARLISCSCILLFHFVFLFHFVRLFFLFLRTFILLPSSLTNQQVIIIIANSHMNMSLQVMIKPNTFCFNYFPYKIFDTSKQCEDSTFFYTSHTQALKPRSYVDSGLEGKIYPTFPGHTCVVKGDSARLCPLSYPRFLLSVFCTRATWTVLTVYCAVMRSVHYLFLFSCQYLPKYCLETLLWWNLKWVEGVIHKDQVKKCAITVTVLFVFPVSPYP